MTTEHEYKHKIDLADLEAAPRCPMCGGLCKPWTDLLFAYARELEARVAKMQAAGDNLVSFVFAGDDAQLTALEAWRNA